MFQIPGFSWCAENNFNLNKNGDNLPNWLCHVKSSLRIYWFCTPNTLTPQCVKRQDGLWQACGNFFLLLLLSVSAAHPLYMCNYCLQNHQLHSGFLRMETTVNKVDVNCVQRKRWQMSTRNLKHLCGKFQQPHFHQQAPLPPSNNQTHSVKTKHRVLVAIHRIKFPVWHAGKQQMRLNLLS